MSFRKHNRESRLENEVLGRRMMAELGLENEEALMRSCRDPKEDIARRGLACLALGYLRFRPAIRVLIGLAEDSDLRLVCESLRGLSLMGSTQPTRPLLRLLRHSSREEVRNAVINALGMLRDKRAIDVLVGILTDREESEYTRSYAAEALGLLEKTDRTIAALVEALKDPSPTIRWSAINSLGLTGDERLTEVLQACVSDHEVVPALPDRETVGSAAETALRNLESCGPRKR